MKHELHCDATERRLRKSGEKYTNKCISTTLKHEGRVSFCGEPFWMLLSVSYFTVKSHFMLWTTGEYFRTACFPQM